MSVVHLIDTVTAWADKQICQKVKLKLPADNLEANDAGYHYTLVTPAAFATYTPTTEKLPPNIHAPIPSLCVRILSGEDSLATNNGTAEIQMCFSAWDPGLHGADIFNPSKDKPGTWERWDTEEAKQYFKRNGTGWRDIWNFVDVALRAVESMPIIEGYRIEPNAPIKFGPLTEQEAIPDFYPLWFVWISFKITYPLVRNIEDYQKFL
ncbi:MAG: hypothetical protein ACLUDG_01960 [Butyricicoccus sp.]